MKGLRVTPREISPPAPVVDLMSALKRSLAQEARSAAKPKRKAAADRRQTNLLLWCWERRETATPATATAPLCRRRKA